jgi:hypothetical protein
VRPVPLDTADELVDEARAVRIVHLLAEDPRRELDGEVGGLAPQILAREA